MDAILMRCKAHDSTVLCANFSPYGDQIVSCGEDELIKVLQDGHHCDINILNF